MTDEGAASEPVTEPPLGRIRVDRLGPVRRILLDRPEVHNAFDAAMIAELGAAFDAVAADDTARVILLTGTGKSFCAGADARWMLEQARQTEAENRADAERLAVLLLAIARCPKPVVARVHGHAIAGGVGLIAAADVAVASESARFRIGEARVGIIPATIGPFLLRKIGPGWARALALTASEFDARQAQAIGLVHCVAPEDRLDAAVARVVDDLLAGSLHAQAAIKRLYDAIEGVDPAAASAETSAALAAARASADGIEGFTAFTERRPPAWRTTWVDATPGAQHRR